jgi:hypothetical protein
VSSDRNPDRAGRWRVLTRRGTLPPGLLDASSEEGVHVRAPVSNGSGADADERWPAAAAPQLLQRIPRDAEKVCELLGGQVFGERL